MARASGSASLDGAAKAAKGRKKIVVKKDGKCEKKKITRQHRVRSWDEAASRCIALKLASFPRSQVENNVNIKGVKIHPLVVAELQRVKPEGKYITLEFWHDMMKSHKLTGGFASCLPSVDRDEHVCKELNSCLKLCHSPNPAAKSPQKLLRWLEYGKCPNETEVTGLLMGSMESPSLSRTLASTISEGVITYIARHKVHELFPEIWSQVSNHYDCLLVKLWQQASAKKQTRSQLLRAHRHALQMFFSMAMAVEVNDASEADGSTGYEEKVVETLTSSSLIGAELFAAEQAQIEVASFIADVDRRLFELEQADFLSSEVSAFVAISQATTAALDDHVWESLQDASIEFEYMSVKLSAPQVHPNDQYNFRLEARKRSIMVATAKVKRTAWEEMLYGATDKIANMPEHIDLPDELVLDCANAREFIAGKLTGWVSVHTCKTTVSKYMPDILKLDRHFWIEAQFLLEQYDTCAEAHFRSCFLDCVPAPGAKGTLNKSVLACRTLATGPVVSAQKKSLIDDMLNGTMALEDIQKCQGPSAKELAAMSHWLQCVHKRAEVFCSCPVEIEEGSMHKRKILVGEEAMAARYEKCCQLSAGSHANDLKEFRAFRWMLTEAQSKQVDAWQRACVHTTKEKLALGKQKALKDLEKEAGEKKARHAEEKGNSMIVVAPKLMAVCGKKASIRKAFENENEDEAEEQEVCASLETGMLSFFGTRAL